MNNSLIPHYSRSFSGFIWRVKIDKLKQKLWFEIRDETAFEVNLFWMSLENGKDGQLLFTDPLQWWDSLLHVHVDILCIQQVEDTSNPGPVNLKLMHALDTSQSQTLNQLLVQEINGNELKVKQGEEIKEIHLTDHERGLDSPCKVQWPIVYPEGHNYQQLVAGFLQKKGINHIAGPIMYMENQGIGICFHTTEKDLIKRSLIWIRNEKIVLRHDLDDKMSGYSTESFFTFNNYLIFIENRRTIKVFRLHTE